MEKEEQTYVDGYVDGRNAGMQKAQAMYEAELKLMRSYVESMTQNDVKIFWKCYALGVIFGVGFSIIILALIEMF